MQEHYDHNNFEENHGRSSAREFERMLRQEEFYFIDLMKVDEIYNYYLSANAWHKADELLSFAIRSHPSSSDLYFKHAHINLELGKIDVALNAINTALQHSPLQAEYSFLKANLLAQEDHYWEAILLLDELIPYVEKPEEILLQKGNIAQICNMPVESEKYYRAALELHSQYEEALYELAFLLESEDRLEGAVQLYREYLNEFPYTSVTWYNLGILYKKLGNYELALDAFDIAVVIQDDFGAAYYKKGQLYLELQRHQEALQAFLNSIVISPNDVFTLYHIAECYESLEMYREAIRYYNKACKRDPDFIDAWIGLGYCLEKRERYLEAIHFYRKALKLDEDNADLCLSLAICEYKLGNNRSAFTYLEQALELNPAEQAIWQDWSQVLHDKDNISGAITYLEEGITLNPTFVSLYYQCAAYCFRSGQTDKALTYLENALLLDYEEHYQLFLIDSNLRESNQIARLLRQYHP